VFLMDRPSLSPRIPIRSFGNQILPRYADPFGPLGCHVASFDLPDLYSILITRHPLFITPSSSLHTLLHNEVFLRNAFRNDFRMLLS
jgi:hypothetical protein